VCRHPSGAFVRLPLGVLPLCVLPLCINGHHDALAAEPLGGFPDQLGACEGGRVEGDLVGPRPEKGPDILDAADASATVSGM
jgi:hypothetical protein